MILKTIYLEQTNQSFCSILYRFICFIVFRIACSNCCGVWPNWRQNCEENTENGLALYYIDFMTNSTQKQPLPCNEHEFSLTPLYADLYIKQPVTLSFCKSNHFPKCRYVEKRTKLTKNSCICCPVFNKDKNYSTSSFILPEEKVHEFLVQKCYIENSIKYKQAHEKRVNDCSDQKSLLLVPRPNVKQPYCGICRVGFSDYLEHIKSQIHRLCSERVPYSYLIKDLASKYDKLNNKNSFCKNSNSNDNTQSCYQIDPEIQILGKPSKRFKSDLSFPPPFYYSFGVTQKTDQRRQPGFEPSPIPHSALPRDLFNQGIAQFPSFTNMAKNQMCPVIPTMNSISYQPVNFAFGVEPSMRMGFPMFYCSSFGSFQQIPQSYYSIPFQPSLQKIQTHHKIEQVDLE